MEIKQIKARQIFDSRGNPTVEADVILENGAMGRAAVPSGTSIGSTEALELRDRTKDFGGLGVFQAIGNIENRISKVLVGWDAADQEGLDKQMRELDGTKNKSVLGANAILAVSMAASKAAAQGQDKLLFQYYAELFGNTNVSIPTPMFNVINGGQHAVDSSDIQEFMIVPMGEHSFAKKMQLGAEIFRTLRDELTDRGYSTNIGDEGGFAPHLKKGNREALDILVAAVKHTDYKLDTDVAFALDVAASELFAAGLYHLRRQGTSMTTSELIAWYEKVCAVYPIISIEDGLDEEDWEGWQELTVRLGSRIQLVGDDLLVTNVDLLEAAIEEQAGNAILLKPNQIGTISETFEAAKKAKSAGWGTILSHRSGETEDVTLAHLAVGIGTDFIKAGSLSRSERLAKYNELLRIEEYLTQNP